VKIINIKIQNFKSYGDKEIVFNLEDFITRIFIGDNGQGKSSIIDGLVWCLYGYSNGKADSIINRENKKDCKVETNFIIDNDLYSIIRYRKHKEHGNKILIFKNKKNISPLKATDSQALIDEIIGINFIAMTSSVIFSAEMYSSFLKSKGSERLKVMDNILNLKIIQKWNDIAKKLKKPITDKIDDLNLKHEKILSGVSTIEENIEDYKKTSYDKIVSFKKERKNLEEEVVKLEEEITEISKIDYVSELKLISEIEEVVDNNLKYNNLIKEENILFEEKKKELNDKTVEFDLQSLADLKLKQEEYSKIDFDELINSIKKNEEIEKKISVLENKLKLITTSEVSLYTKNIKKLQTEYDKFLKQRKELEKNICPMCKSVLDDNKDLIIEVEKEIDYRLKKIEEIKLLKSNLEKENLEKEEKNSLINEEIKLLREDWKIITDSMDEVLLKKEEFSTLKNSIKLLTKDFETTDLLNKEYIKQIDSLVLNHNTLIENLTENLIEEKNNSKFSKDFLMNLEIEVENLNKVIYEKKDEIKNINVKAKESYDKDFIIKLENKKKVLVKGMKEVVSEIKEYKIKEGSYIKLLQLLSNKNGGVKKYIISKIISSFNEKINYYLPMFFDYKVEIMFDEDLNETILVKEKEVEFDTFSSGEKARFEIAIAFSLFLIVKKFFSSSISFIVFDEILDNNLDNEGIRRIIDVIKSLEKNNSIIVISHKDEYKDLFNNKFYIKKDKDNFSYVKAG